MRKSCVILNKSINRLIKKHTNKTDDASVFKFMKRMILFIREDFKYNKSLLVLWTPQFVWIMDVCLFGIV